jgi:hypothetical protein
MRKLFNFKLEHPFDWIGHAGVCFLVTFLSGQFMIPCHAVLMGINTGLTIEGTQIESGIWQMWDHLIDIAADTVGVLIALFII